MRTPSVCIYLNEVRYLLGAVCAIAGEMGGLVVGDDETGDG
jgi:hypothetical protein